MTELEKAARMALEFCEFCSRDVALNDYALEKLEQTTAALTQALATTEPKCACGDRPASQCDEEWGPQCDLGNNPKYARPATIEPVNLKDPAVQKRLAAQWGYVHVTTERKGEPVWSDLGAWLWAKLADYCRRKGLNPHHENDLFNLAGELRSMLAHTSPQVPEDVIAILDECRTALIECDRDCDYELIDRAYAALDAARK